MNKNVKEEKVLKVTSIDELREISNGELVELPGFTSGTTFVARLKRPSMLGLVKTKRIPNSLLNEANKLFSGGVSKVTNTGIDNDKTMEQLMNILEIICEESFIEPTYKDLKENNIELTDEQLMAIFSYTQRGLKSLENFR
ncbi:MAG: hypothetical protein J6T10_22700 [Methanobrevibacter sp.]|nr:hypothetical protein [Methanobrevibacter sp.]